MGNYQKKLELDLVITSHELADMFCNMNSTSQAEFFSKCGENMNKWGAGKMDAQLWHVGKESELTDEGIQFMKSIGETVINLNN